MPQDKPAPDPQKKGKDASEAPRLTNPRKPGEDSSNSLGQSIEAGGVD